MKGAPKRFNAPPLPGEHAITQIRAKLNGLEAEVQALRQEVAALRAEVAATDHRHD